MSAKNQPPHVTSLKKKDEYFCQENVMRDS